MSEEKATAILVANLKGSKKKPTNVLQIAMACSLLLRVWGIKKMCNFFNISEYQLRQINKINELTPPVKKLVSDYKFGIESSYHLSRIHDESLQLKVAREAEHMTAHQIRNFVSSLLNDEKLTVTEAKKLSSDSQVKVLVLPLQSQTFRTLAELANVSKTNVHDLVLSVLEDYIHAQKKA